MGSPREDTADYAKLFLGDAPLLDTRAPLEFDRGAFPLAHNLPLMSDEERAAVGTCYKQQGQAAAITLGHQLVSGSLREARLNAWRAFAASNPEGYLYCFRGGLRSQLVQQWLRESGVDYPRVTGGYKAMRRFLLDNLAATTATGEFWLVAGATGCGKTRVLKDLPRVVDLEGLARHRGSAFGRLLDEQPTQIDFENALSVELLKLARQPGPIILEDEGALIGRLALPEALRARMAEAPLLLLEYPVEARVDQLVNDYITDLGARFEQRYPGEGIARHRERLLGDLGRTRKRLGGERHRELAALMSAAFDAQQACGDIEAHRLWIRRLLVEYYDPMYSYQLSHRKGPQLCVGNRETIADFVAERRVNA